MLLIEFCLLVFGTCSWESPPNYLSKFLKSCTCLLLCVLHCWTFMVIYILLETLATIFLSHSNYLTFTSNCGSTFGRFAEACGESWNTMISKYFAWNIVAFEEYACAKYSHIFSWRPSVVSDNLYTNVYSLFTFFWWEKLDVVSWKEIDVVSSLERIYLR